MVAADARFFGDKFLVMECTLEAETSVSNLTQYKLFIGDDKKIIMLFGVTFSFKRQNSHENRSITFYKDGDTSLWQSQAKLIF